MSATTTYASFEKVFKFWKRGVVWFVIILYFENWERLTCFAVKSVSVFSLFPLYVCGIWKSVLDLT